MTRFSFSLLIAFAAIGAVADSTHGKYGPVPPGTDAATIERIIDTGKSQNKVMDLLFDLTRNVGTRLTGSDNGYKACRWAERKFKEFGLKNVHLEEWGQMPVGFNRGKRQSAKMVAPYEADLVFTTDAWTAGTTGPMRGKAVLAPKNDEEFEKVKDKLKGAWVIYERASGGRGGVSELEKKIGEAGILGRVTSTGRETVTTGGRFTGLEWDKLPTERRVKIRKSDYDKIASYLTLGQNVELEFDIENIFVKGPVKLYNVIADIPGTEKPDEIVIVCGHLDSWDGPGSQGANDNGTGTVSAMEAARLLMKSGAKPKRTIRFILWTGEEQGLLGSRAYVEKHKDEWPKISAVLNDDGGTNYHGGHVVLQTQVPAFQPIVDVMNKAFPDLPQKLNVVERMPRGGSSDHASFNMVGIPGFYTIETGRADYGFVWHTQNDRPEHSIPEYLVQSSTDHAVMSYSLACAPEMLAREARPAGGGGGGVTPLEPAGGRRHYHADDEHRHDDGHDHDDDYIAYVIDVARRSAVNVLRLMGR